MFREKNLGYLFVILAGTLFGSIPIFGSLLNQFFVSALEQTFFRILFVILILFIFFNLKRRTNLFRINKQDYKFFCLFGLFGIALFFTFYLSSIVLTNVAVAVLLLYTQPIFTVILARFLLKENINITRIVAIILSFTGVCITLRIWTFGGIFGETLLGDLFGLAAGFCYAVYIILSRESRFNKNYDYLTVTFWSFLFGIIWLIPLSIIFWTLVPYTSLTGFTLDLSINAWVLLLGFAIIATLFAYASLNRGIKQVQASRAGILLLLEPISAIAMGVLILNQPLLMEEIIGAVFILLAVIMVTTEKGI